MNLKIMSLLGLLVCNVGFALYDAPMTVQDFTKKLLATSLEEAKDMLDDCSLQERYIVRQALQQELVLWVAQHGSADHLEARKPWCKDFLSFVSFATFASGCGATLVNLIDFLKAEFSAHQYRHRAYDYLERAVEASKANLPDLEDVLLGNFEFFHAESRKYSGSAASNLFLAAVGAAVAMAGYAAFDYYLNRDVIINRELDKFERIKDLINYCA